jgi:hypothetical protein
MKSSSIITDISEEREGGREGGRKEVLFLLCG